jgi:hypothetical protein
MTRVLPDGSCQSRGRTERAHRSLEKSQNDFSTAPTGRYRLLRRRWKTTTLNRRRITAPRADHVPSGVLVYFQSGVPKRAPRRSMAAPSIRARRHLSSRLWTADREPQIVGTPCLALGRHRAAPRACNTARRRSTSQARRWRVGVRRQTRRPVRSALKSLESASSGNDGARDHHFAASARRAVSRSHVPRARNVVLDASGSVRR